MLPQDFDYNDKREDILSNIRLTSPGMATLAEYASLPMDIHEFLELAISISDRLSKLHEISIFYGRINSRTVLINRNAGRVYFADLGSSHESNDLAYIAPEQTGRMNRLVDHRADLYSLGIVFYELLCGSLPFQAQDALEWVHCHIARPVLPLHERYPHIPEGLSLLIQKLISKAAEERYQTASGLRDDLSKCLIFYRESMRIEPFSLGETDISDRLLIPQRLYGRSLAIHTLLQAFNKMVSKGRLECVLISGYSGIGKTSLVQTINQAIVNEAGFFISGKFEKYKGSIPYASIANAFTELIQQILMESEANIAEWRQQLLLALGGNAQLIVDIIPHLELIIGKQPPVPEMPLTEAQNRFHMVFRQFLGVFARRSHPLVLFLDDLQWIDLASLRLFEDIFNHRTSMHLLLIGAYRDQEVGATHPLASALQGLVKMHSDFKDIKLSPLTFQDVNDFLKDTLHSSMMPIPELAGLLYEKTAGNPFFLIQFLKTLYAEGLLHFDIRNRSWNWNIEQIRAQGYTDNVIELMLEKMRRLPVMTQNILKMAACIGSRFSLDTLAAVAGMSGEESMSALDEAWRQGLITIGRDNEIAFIHDRVAQSAYALIPRDELPWLHLSIGRLWLESSDSQELDDRIFDIAFQLNRGSEFIVGDKERLQLAGLNYAAGEKAISSTAYGPAYNYFLAGLQLLRDDCWERQYNQSLAFHEKAAATAYLSRNFESSDDLVNIALEHAVNVLDRVKSYEIKIESFIAQGKVPEAIRAGLEILAMLGLVLSEKPTGRQLISCLNKIRNHTLKPWQKEKIADLVNLPPMTDPVSLAKAQILNAITSAAYISAPDLMPLVAINMVDLSVKCGNCEVSPFGYAAFGFVLCSTIGDIDSGYRFGTLALDLMEKIDATKSKAKTLYLFNGFIRHSRDHLRDTLEGSIEAYHIGLESGDFEYAARSLTLYPRYLYLLGEELGTVASIMDSHSRIIEQLGQTTSLTYIRIFQQAVANLTSDPPRPSLLEGPFFGEQEMMPQLEMTGNKLGAFLSCYNKCFLAYIFGDYDEALKSSVIGRLNLPSSRGLFHFYEFHCYESLILLAVNGQLDEKEQAAAAKQVADNQKKLKKWAHFGPSNHLHRWHLVEAERHRLKRRYKDAFHSYQQAIALAAENGYVYEEALAWERAALCYHEYGNPEISRIYFREAMARYQRWGAITKVNAMMRRYDFLQSSYSSHEGSLNYVGQLDSLALIKSSQAVSSEIMVPSLMKTLMRIVMENAGAQKGALIISAGAALSVYATASWQESGIQVDLPMDQGISPDILPEAIINYVSRAHEKVIIDDAVSNTILNSDPYISVNQPRSIICLPIIRQNRLLGLLYLENNLVSKAFTPNILTILDLIASQAAISLENALLYTNLQNSERRFRAIFEQTFQLTGLLSIDGILLEANQAALQYMGVDESEVIGLPFWDTPWWTHSREEQRRLKSAIQKAAQGKFVRFETTHPAHNGQINYIDFSLKPVTDEKGRVVLLIPEGRDISERKEMENALRESEEKYRTIFEHTGTATIIIEPDTTISLGNTEFSRLVKRNLDDIEGLMKWTEFAGPEDLQRMLDYHNRRRRSDSSAPGRYEFNFIDSQGRQRYTIISIAMIPGTQKSVAAIIDITDKRQIEDKNTLLQNLLINIINSMPSILVAVDDLGIVTQWNSHVEQNTGVSRQQALGRPLLDVFPVMQGYTDLLDLALRQGLTQKAEKVITYRDGKPYYADITIYPLGKNEAQGAVVRIDDVSDKVRMNEIMMQTEKMMSVGGLAAGMAHEINNPLGGIIQGAQNIERRLDPSFTQNMIAARDIDVDLEKIRAYLERRQITDFLAGIKQSGIRASRIVRNMLQFSRSSISEHTPQCLEQLCEKSLELASSDYDLSKNYDFRYIQIVRHYTPDLGQVLCSDTEIEQVLINLFKNAAQAMTPLDGAADPRIILRTFTEGEMAVLEVEDNGPGMNEYIKRRIFEPFFTTKGTGEGTGLGLSVSYFIITRNHNGQMYVESAPSQGAKFTIKLPLCGT